MDALARSCPESPPSTSMESRESALQVKLAMNMLVFKVLSRELMYEIAYLNAKSLGYPALIPEKVFAPACIIRLDVYVVLRAALKMLFILCEAYILL